ncbi:MAG: hypothetical protein R3E53_16790 [Myxococcota bacterium]
MANQGPRAVRRVISAGSGDSQGDQSYAKRRYADEVNRLYGMDNPTLRSPLPGRRRVHDRRRSLPLDRRLEGSGRGPQRLPYFKRWFRELSERPGVQRGMAVGADLSVDYGALPPEEIERLKAMLYNQRARPAPEGGLL